MIKISEPGPKRKNLDKAIQKLLDELPEDQRNKITSPAKKISSGNKGNVIQLCHKFKQPKAKEALAKVYLIKKQKKRD